MDYLRIYNQIVERGKSRILTGYTETHHIIPKCNGGNNEYWNLVNLTAREHFICHLLLCEIYPQNKKLRFALWNMCNVKRKYQQRYVVGSRMYNFIREEYSKHVTGKNNPRYGKKLSEEIKNKISKSRICVYVGEKNPFYGKNHSNETKEKLKIKSSQHKHSDKTKEKMSLSRKNKLWFYNDNGEQLRTYPDDLKIINEGWRKGRLYGKELSKLANEKRKEKYSIIEPKKPNSKKCMIDGISFNSAVEAAKHFKMPDSSVRDRLRNKNFPNWIWI
jgi:hypothetical protein